jgi:hypothetical protein
VRAGTHRDADADGYDHTDSLEHADGHDHTDSLEHSDSDRHAYGHTDGHTNALRRNQL